MGWKNRKPWLDDPNSILQKGHYKGRTWQSLMDENFTCGNIFCELGEDGGRKVHTYEEWASERKNSSPTTWMKSKIEAQRQLIPSSGVIACCCPECSSTIQNYRRHYGTEDKERMNEEQIKDALGELLLNVTGSDEVTSENLYEMVLRFDYPRSTLSPSYDHSVTLARILWHVRGRGLKKKKNLTRWFVLELVERYYPDVHEEFMNTHFWLLSRRTRSRMDMGVGEARPLLKHNLKAIDFILKCGIENWETKRGRALTVDDLIEFGWIYPNVTSDYKSVITQLQTNEVYVMFKDVGEEEGDLAKSLFGRRMKGRNWNRMYSNSVYSPGYENGTNIDTLLTHLEQKVRFRDVLISDALRDGRGRYVKKRCTFEAIASRFPRAPGKTQGRHINWFYGHSKWRDIAFRRRMIAKTVSYLRPSVNVTDDFPHDLSHDDMFKVANLGTRMLETVSTWYPICKATRLQKYGYWGQGASWGIQTVLEANWGIELDELVWNHNHTLPELEVNTFLNDMVDSMSMGRARTVMKYRRPLSWAIGNGRKRKPYMCYTDTGMPIEFDLYVPRFKVTNPDSEYYGQWVDECVVELQGPHHYKVVKWNNGCGKRNSAAIPIDESHPEWDKWSKNHENIVRHDRIKKRRLGKSIAYIPVCSESVPVTGVHGDLGTYNYRHVTEKNTKEGKHGLSELFEMQDKKTIGSLLREWYDWYKSVS